MEKPLVGANLAVGLTAVEGEMRLDPLEKWAEAVRGRAVMAVVDDAKAAARMVLSLHPTLNDITADGLERLGLAPDERPDVQTLILITHEPDIAAMADRILHLEDGKIISDTAAE